MARPVSTAVSVPDLTHITAYLVRLAYAPLRGALSAGDDYSIRTERPTLLKTALIVEELNMPWDRDRCSDVERCCATLETVIKKTLSTDALKRMRTAVRQMRLQEAKELSDLSLAGRYARWSSEDDQQALDI